MDIKVIFRETFLEDLEGIIATESRRDLALLGWATPSRSLLLTIVVHRSYPIHRDHTV
jgi:hypothetical protein